MDLLVWTRSPEKQFVLVSDLNFSIDRNFRDGGVEIPFPQRDLNLRMTPAFQRLLPDQEPPRT